MATPKLKKSVSPQKDEEEIKDVLTPEEKEPQYDNSIPVNEDGETEAMEMLAGYIDKDGNLQKTFTIREITGRDEEAISKGDVKNNPSKVVTTLLERCVGSIGSIEKTSVSNTEWKEIIKNLYVGDQDYILIKLRELSMGKEIETAHTCPKCGQSLKTYIDVSELEIMPFKGQRKVPFTLPKGYVDKKGERHTEGFMRLAMGKDRDILTPIARKNIAQAETLMLTRLCTFEEGVPVTEDTMRDLTLKDRQYLQQIIQDNLFGVDLTTTVTCTSCGEEFKGNLSAVNFL